MDLAGPSVTGNRVAASRRAARLTVNLWPAKVNSRKMLVFSVFLAIIESGQGGSYAKVPISPD